VNKRAGILAISIVIMLLAPTLVITAVNTGPRSLVRQITTFGSGNPEDFVTFSGPGEDANLYLTIPNGATIISATFNVSGEKYASEYPENVTLDVGDDGDIEWAFEGDGYGYLGHQVLISNSTNFTRSMRVPFYEGGTNDTILIRLPKEANVTKAVLKLEGSKGTGPSQITTINKMQSWAPNQWVRQGTRIMVNELNGNILYDNIEFDIGDIPDTAFVSNATFWWGRDGASHYGQNPGTYSFDDDLSVHRIEESWNLGVTNVLDEGPTEDTNAMVNSNVFYDWNVTLIMASWVEGTHENYGLCIHRDDAADRDKWDYSLVPYIDVQYGSPGNVTMEIEGGANIEVFSQSNIFDTTAVVTDFSDDINDYLASHGPDVTDEFGNAFVDIPFSLSSTDPGRVTISDIDIEYQYVGVVDVNPTTGNLTNELDDLVPDIIDGGSADIPISFFSNNTGKVKASGLGIDFLPPDHSASIDSHTPEELSVTMNENETIDFEITVSDLYNYPMTVVWYMDGDVYVEGQYNMTYFADFESAGRYNITVVVNNELHDTSLSWNLIVMNVNRNPIIDSVEPQQMYEMDENSTSRFNITAYDPDGDPVRYNWLLDDMQVGGNEPFFEYTTDFFDAGLHDIKVTVFDPKALNDVMIWHVTVKDVNAFPVITDSTPASEVEMYEIETKRFTVKEKSIDGDKHDIYWYLDGNETGVEGRYYDYFADYESSGLHVVEVEVTDGELSAKRSWDVTVIDVNRPPDPRIDAPEDKEEFLEWDEIDLDGAASSDPDRDALDLTWSDNEEEIGTGEELTVNLERGRHTIKLTVDDGKDGGINSTYVSITVRYIEFDGIISTDNVKPVGEDAMIVSLQLTNEGDGSYDEMEVFFVVDGVNISSQTIVDIEPDKDFLLEFPWTAEEGTHTLEFVIGEQNFSQPITVGKKPLINQGNSWMWSIILLIVVLAVIVTVIVIAKRRRRPDTDEPEPVAQEAPPPVQPAPAYPQSAPTYPQQTPAYTQPAPAPVQPTLPPPPPLSPPPVQPVRALPPPPPPQTQQPTVDEEVHASDMVDKTEEMIRQHEAKGGDGLKARNTLRIAKNFHDKGKYSKAIYYCQRAESYLK